MRRISCVKEESSKGERRVLSRQEEEKGSFESKVVIEEDERGLKEV